MQYSHLITAGLLVIICLLSLFNEGCCCGLMWLKYGDHCYRFYPLRLTRHMARLRCLVEGSDLASISNDSVLQFIAEHAAHAEGDRFWVGLERESDGHLKWLDGTPNAETEPWVKQPDMSAYSPESINFRRTCFAYNGALVKKEPCFERFGLICGHHVTNTRNRTSCNWDVDRTHSFIGDATGNCLFKAPQKTTKDHISDLCERYDGRFVDVGDMVSDGLSAFYDHKVLTNDGSKYWTGFTWNGTDMFWSFGHSVPKEFPIPVIRGNGSCITVQFNFTDILQTHFYQTDCDEEANVVCSKVMEEFESEKTTPSNTESTQERPQMDSPMSCPEGYNWKSDTSGDYCYWETSYETEHLSWTDAEAYCSSYGGHLASFHSADEEKIGLSFQYGSLAHPYWIGLSLDVETETYKWSDGSSLDYENWAPGHPNHRDKRLRCVAMEAQEKHWVSSLCGILSWFICKVPKRDRHYTATRPTPAPLEPCDKDVTETKMSYRYQGACYIAVSESYSWHRAKQYCENEGATLVSIHSGEEIGFLLKLMHESSAMETNRVWIGLNSFSPDDSFHWTDWSPVDFTFFSEKEPNNYKNQEKCCNMYVRNGQWNDENCNAALGFICKWVNESAGSTTIPTTIDPRIGNCKKGWFAHDDRCYYLGGARQKDRVNWTTATSICQKEGGYLTSIRNEKDQAFLAYLLQTLQVDVWIGLHDTIQSGRYYWLDNSEIRYTYWAPGEPSFFGITEDCVKMVYDHLDSGVWKDDDCDRKFGYICQNRKDPQLPKPSYEINFDCLQPKGWIKLENMCFKMFGGNLLTWGEAESACKKEGGHLVSVSDQRVKAVVSYLATEVNQPFFIGLKYQSDIQSVTWLNDNPVMLTNWEKNEPSHFEENTCFASTSEGYWKKTSCDEQMPFLCQITTGKPTKQKQYTGNCPTSSNLWIPGSGSFCYILQNDQRYDWFSANLVCFMHATHLVSIHSMNEINDLKKLMKDGVESVFTGLMRNKKGGFTWTDDTPVDFVNWDEGEPSSNDQCVEMMANSMKWRVTNCISKKWFICMDRKDTLVYEDPHNAEFKDEQMETESMGLSTSAICAIVLSILVGVILLAAAVFYHQKYSKKSQFRRHIPDHSISFENALYKVGSANMEFHEESRDSL